MTQIRLLARCQMHGEVREPGYTFDMPQFETIELAQEYLTNLPHTVADHGNPHAANIRADLHGTSIDAVTGGQYVGPIQMPVQNVPLFEIIGGEVELKAVEPVPPLPPDPNMVILPSGPADQKPPGAPLEVDRETGAILSAGDTSGFEAGKPSEGAGGAVTSQAESGEQVEPVERIEDGQEQAEGEAHHDDGAAA